MHAIALHFASGMTFFWRMVLLVALSAARLWLRKPAFRSARRLATIAAILLVALSATPLPYWLYGLWAVPVAAMLASPLPLPTGPTLRRLGLSLAVILVSLTTLTLELSYVATGQPEGPTARTLVVIADSISAGVGDETTTWPALLERERELGVVDLSRPGETCASALRAAEALEVQDPARTIVLLEIGGNDMLGWASVAQFRQDLDRLLGVVARSGAPVYLMELPLPPFHNGYGAAQRSLAPEHGAVLIPKRYFARVLGARGATIDGLHLSQRGQRLMGDTLARILPLPNS